MYMWCMVAYHSMYVYMVHGDILYVYVYGAWWHIISIQYIWCMVTYMYIWCMVAYHKYIVCMIIMMVVMFYPIGPAIY